MEEKMFCFQCEQTACGTGCTRGGVCGKTPECAAYQDLLLELVKELATRPDASAELLADGLFTTVTNVNFDAGSVLKQCRRVAAAIPRELPENETELLEWAHSYAIPFRQERFGVDIAGLQELILYGLKGMAAYRHHAARLGLRDAGVDDFLRRALAALGADLADREQLVKMALDTGKWNYRAMELLNEGHIRRFGAPEPVRVRITPVKGKAILVSGHDLDDLEALLEQTRGSGISVYTHGEMLPAHGYPKLHSYENLIGNYGGAWQDQQKEFDAFPGAILMTTNCIQRPRPGYAGRIFTTGLVEYPGVTHVRNGDFKPVIDAALAAPGFPDTETEKFITVGFGHDAVGAAAGKVVEAVKSGRIRHFFLIGGCDGARPGRNYYTQLAEAVPDDCVILTLACGKYRFNKLEFGEIDGIPRLLDVGQCNDAYSAVRIASMLAEAFGCGVNDLPLSIILSWYEQKAVAVLLTLLALGVKNIKLGPSLPAFVTPAILDLLVKEFGIAPVSTPEADLAAALK